MKKLLHHHDAGDGGNTGGLKSFYLIVFLISYYKNMNEDNLLQRQEIDASGGFDEVSAEEDEAMNRIVSC